jgi:hypothetical protein
MIKPTVGRVVHFRPSEADCAMMNVFGVGPLSVGPLSPQDEPGGAAQPLRADVVFVWNDHMVNLLVTDHIGETYIRQRVPLRQDDDPVPPGSYCEWMEYQKGQAARAEALDAELAKKGFAD